MNIFWLATLIFGLMRAAFLVAGATNNPSFSSATNKYCAGGNYSANNSCYDDQGTFISNTISTGIQQATTGWGAIITAALIGGAIIGLLSGALNLLAVIPFLLAWVMFNFIVMPFSGTFITALPAPIPMLIQMFFYLAAFLASMSFIRSGY